MFYHLGSTHLEMIFAFGRRAINSRTPLLPHPRHRPLSRDVANATMVVVVVVVVVISTPVLYRTAGCGCGEFGGLLPAFGRHDHERVVRIRVRVRALG